MSAPPPAQSHAARYGFVFVLGVLIGLVCTVMVARTLQARRDPVPDSLMQVMDHQLRALPGPSSGSCEPARQHARLQTLQLLATDLEPVFGEDRRFEEHAQALRAAIAAPLHAPNLDCTALTQARAQISEACEACHRDFR
ncbi:hypothetical protein TR80_011945 [Xanthomonas campestris]|uniref:cytochrome c n=1 Tax=Xanthomonas campestris TaxID=339 RepID=UPI000CDB7239|nr:cytochrome c [Xanthomonas campestris]TXD41994.1 hypothetical protein TR80_011945 [Xanthomonas campestris]